MHWLLTVGDTSVRLHELLGERQDSNCDSASMGIGLAIASYQPSTRKADTRIEGLSRRAEIIQADISKSWKSKALMEKSKNIVGSIDILANNTGWTANSLALDVTEE